MGVMPWGVTSPIVRAGKVVDFISGAGQKGHQNFPVDMAGFATHLSLINQRKPSMPYLATREEEGFLRNLKITYDDIMPLAKNCTEILVWRTMSFTPRFRPLPNLTKISYSDTNLPQLTYQKPKSDVDNH